MKVVVDDLDVRADSGVAADFDSLSRDIPTSSPIMISACGVLDTMIVR